MNKIRLKSFSPNSLDALNHFEHRPLIVDLDGTLSRRDIFLSLLLTYILKNPWLAPGLLVFVLRYSLADLKRKLASDQPFDWSNFPTNEPLLDYLRTQHGLGREIYLCSGAAETHVKEVYASLAIFTGYIASNSKINLVGRNKAKLLSERFGTSNFDYIGDSRKDLRLKNHARMVVIVQPRSIPKMRAVLQQMRWKHWIKNLLVFIPLLAAHQITAAEKWVDLGILFISLCFVASGTYILNDIVDLESDSKHPRKRFRPLASGNLGLIQGLSLSIVLIVLAFGALVVSQMWPVAVLLAGYIALSTIYSMALKKMAFIDTTFLAGLFVYRIVMGTMTAALPVSYWLLAFSFFVFYSLATVKRFTEVSTIGKGKVPGRDYERSDATILGQIGVSSGLVACAIFTLYANSDAVRILYPSHIILLLCVPAITFWFSHLWLKAGRGEVNSDPIEWALRDRMSLATALFICITVVAASMKLM